MSLRKLRKRCAGVNALRSRKARASRAQGAHGRGDYQFSGARRGRRQKALDNTPAPDWATGRHGARKDLFSEAAVASVSGRFEGYIRYGFSSNTCVRVELACAFHGLDGPTGSIRRPGGICMRGKSSTSPLGVSPHRYTNHNQAYLRTERRDVVAWPQRDSH